jgi:chromate transport protein ChrA
MAVGGLLSFVKESIEEFYTTRIEQYHLEHPTNIIEWIHCTKILFRLRKETPLESPSSDFIESGTNEYEHVPRPAIGVVVFIVFILCATAIFVIPNYVQLPDLAALFMLFFRIGCTIFGGGNVLVPILLTEMEGMITDQQFFDGFIIQSSLPGPFYNITSYLGGVVGGWLGAIVCWLTIYVPGFFFMYSILPFWGKIQHKPFVRKILTGVNAAAIGLVVTAVVMLYTKAVRTEIDAMFVVIAFGMVMIHNTPAPLVVLIVGLSAFFSFFIKMY